MTPLPNCAILIPTRNRPEILQDSLERLRALGLEHVPLWVYDDASDDPATIAHVVHAAWPGAELVRGTTQRGQAFGRNALLRACGAPFAIMLDDDQYFLDLGNLSAYTQDREDREGLAGVAFQCRVKSSGRLDIAARVPAKKCPFFMGGAVLFDVERVLGTGGFREYWRYGYEEPELAARLYARGYYLQYEPRILVEHNHLMTEKARRDETEYDYLYARNAILLDTLNMPLWVGLPTGLARSIRRSLHFNRNWRAKARGTFAGLAMTFSLWQERHPMSTRQALDWLRFNRTWQEPEARRTP